MTRLQKKCFVAAIGSHGLLLVVVLGAAAFRPRPDLTEQQVLDIVPTTLLDGNTSSGGAAASTPASSPRRNSSPATAEPVLPAPRTHPRSTPRETAVTPNETPAKPSKTKPAPEKITPDKTAPIRHSHSYDFDIPTTGSRVRTSPPKNNDSSSAPSSPNSIAASRREELMKEEASLTGMVRERAGDATVVTLPGESNGETFSSYRAYVGTVYHDMWRPQVTGDGLLTAKVTIVVSRDGTVVSSEIVKSSDDSSFNRSVQQVLEKVTKLRPFPSGATDEQRSFSITFKPEPKLSSG